MSQFPHPSELQHFFGKIEIGADGRPTPRWEARHMTMMNLPYAMRLSWRPELTVRRIRVNRAVTHSLGNCLYAIKELYDPETLKALGLDLFGQCYNFGLNCSGLSLHSYGIAIDLNPDGCAVTRHRDLKQSGMPPEVVEIFKAEGWTWGGSFQPRPAAQTFAAISL